MRTSDIQAREGLGALSVRELEVLSMTSQGLTNVEIARRLEVTVHAVKFHLGAIYRKLGVSNRTEAAAAYFVAERGSIDATGTKA